MSTCCDDTTPDNQAKKLACPKCGTLQNNVLYQTIIHQLSSPATLNLDLNQAYYFCKNAACDGVYFDSLGKVFIQQDCRQDIGQKSTAPKRQICYCFDVTYDQVIDEFAAEGRSKTKAFVIAQTKSKNCACETRNPSGRCCLVDFPQG